MADSVKQAKQRIERAKSFAKPAKTVVSAGSVQFKGFIDFLRTQGVVGLAVGLVLGTAVSTLARSLMDNIVLPPVGWLLGSADGLRGLTWTIGRTSDEPVVILYGTFLNDLINFIILALVVYLVFHLLGLTKLDKKKE
jgi:large conductance mechanosensitive channel